MPKPLIRFDDLSISFTQVDGTCSTVVSHLNLAIQPGEVVGLIGESGSGKTLTALSVLGLHAHAQVSGHIWFGQRDLLNLTEAEMLKIRGKAISMIFQEPLSALNPLHKIGKQIAEAVYLHQPHLKKKQVNEKVVALLIETGLTPAERFIDAYPHKLSGGQRQRAMIAMALVNEPKLLIADEPTTALDRAMQQDILDLLKKLQSRYKMSILCISHDIQLVRRFADSLAIMRHGELMEYGKADQVFRQPQHEYTKALIAAMVPGKPVDHPLGKSVLEVKHLALKVPVYKGIFRLVSGYKTLLEPLSFNLSEGETLGVIGQSGSGKTTLARCLVRLYEPEGSVVFLGQQIAASTKQAKQIKAIRPFLQMVFQDPFASLNPRMQVLQIVAEGLLVHCQPDKSAFESQVNWALTQVGLAEEIKWRYPHELSGGQRQRVALARVIILKPKLIILDEPTSALDKITQQQILVLLKSLQSKFHLSYLLISHDLQVIADLSHKVIVLYQGRVVEQGTTHAVFTEPQHEYTQALVRGSVGDFM